MLLKEVNLKFIIWNVIQSTSNQIKIRKLKCSEKSHADWMSKF